ncbi:MAG: hypothetical protein JXR58_11310 [Bacteroidales bacterium]|nr:hypothetical protein [Bacteroidales bacterium]
MKRQQFFVLVLAMVIPFLTIAQDGKKVNPKLKTKYSQEYLDKMLADNPDRMEFLNFYTDNTCYIVDMPSKPIDFIELEKLNSEPGMEKNIEAKDLVNFNMYNFNIVPSLKDTKYYKAGNTGKLIIVRPENDVNRMYENSKRTK